MFLVIFTAQSQKLIMTSVNQAFYRADQIKSLYTLPFLQAETVFPVIFPEELTKVSHTPSAPNAVDVLLNITGQIKVDNMLHIADIQTTGSHL